MATKINIDGSVTPISTKNGVFSLDELRTVIGCEWVEAITLANGNVMIVDEDGKSKQLPKNGRATSMAMAAGIHPNDFISGVALVCKPTELN